MCDSLGYNTYYGPRGSSTIDYIIVAEELVNSFMFISAMPPTELSDHCVVCCGVKVNAHCNYNIDEFDIECSVLPDKYIIDSDSKQKYVASLVDEESSKLLQTFLNDIENNAVNIDTLSTQFTQIIQCAAFKSCQLRQINMEKRKQEIKKEMVQWKLFYK